MSTRRKAIPWRVKCEVALAKLGLTIREVEFDHYPALALRPWDDETGDTIPPANSVEHIQILTIADHREKTFGRRGSSDLSISGNGDLSRAAKVERLEQSRVEFRQRILAKQPGQPRDKRGTIKGRGFETGKSRRLGA